MWWYAVSKGRLFSTKISEAWQKKITRQYYIFGPSAYLVAFVAAFFSPVLSLGICLALAVYWAVQGTPTLDLKE
jgi:hypothetical protein